MSSNPTQQLLVIDNEIFNEMRELLEDEFEETIAEFKQDTPNALQQLNEAAEQQRIATIVELCHTLGSSSGHMGFTQFAQLCRHIEGIAREQGVQAGSYLPMIEQLQQNYQQLVKQLES